ncbi:MAG TPA: hypothetical protein ENK87_02320 [Nitratifractor sp.]|jgi:hypothetical protein|nr:hypothetical protein [Nitratifractor sp.]HHH20740.1 hypothetical protein [Nitratifractor sp.]
MQAILVILVLFIGVFFIVSGDLHSSKGGSDRAVVSGKKSSSTYSFKSPEHRSMSFDIGHIHGKDIIYIDRRVFRESLKQHLAKEAHFRIKYNPFMQINFSVNQKEIYKKYYRANYNGNRQYRVERKLVVYVKYAVYNSKKQVVFRDEFTYRVILKAGSAISYAEANHKSHRKLFWILGKIVAKRLNRNYTKVGSRVY